LADINQEQRATNDQFLDHLAQIFSLQENLTVQTRISKFFERLRGAQGDPLAQPHLQEPETVQYLNFSIRGLLTIIPVKRWSRIQALFSCPIPHCTIQVPASEEHYRIYQALFSDNLFADKFVIMLSAIICWRFMISNKEEHSCLFCRLGCKFTSHDIHEIDVHIRANPTEARMFLSCLGTF
jgi:hypothetical protein